jgi:hypothetical protein
MFAGIAETLDNSSMVIVWAAALRLAMKPEPFGPTFGVVFVQHVSLSYFAFTRLFAEKKV